MTLAGVTLAAGRGRDPRDAAARHGRRRRRGPRRRHRHGAHPGSRRRRRRPRAAAGDPGPPQGRRPRARRPDRAVGRRTPRTTSRRTSPRSPRRSSPTAVDARLAGRSRRPRPHAPARSRRRPGRDLDPPPGGADEPPPRSGRSSWGWRRCVVVLDQLTKAWLTSFLAPGQMQSVVGDYIRLVHGQNNGALFGLFRDSALLFGIVSLGVIALIVGYHARGGRSVYLSITLGLLLGGALGNLIDRLRLGYVVDFVDPASGRSAGTRSTSPTRRSASRWSCSCSSRDPAVARGHDAARPGPRHEEAADVAVGRADDRARCLTRQHCSRAAAATCASPTAPPPSASTGSSPTSPGCRGATSRS